MYYDRNVQQLDIPDLASHSDKTPQDQDMSISPGYIRALLSFVTGCHTILQSFLDASTDEIRALPMITMFRVPYAFKALAILRARCKEPGTAIGQIIDEETINFDFYAGQIFRALENASAGGTYAFPTMPLSIRASAARDQSLRSFETSMMDDQNMSMFAEQPFTSMPELFVGDMPSMCQINGPMPPDFTNDTDSYIPTLASQDNAVWRYGFPGI